MSKTSYENTEFVGILRQCMGPLSQLAYAKKVGITPASINRILNSNEHRPARLTLRKIAIASPDITTYEELLRACGYGEDDEYQSFEKRSRVFAEVMKNALAKACRKIKVYPSLEAFVREVEMDYLKERITRIRVHRTREYRESKYPGAESYAVISARIANKAQECEIFFVAYYLRSIGGNYIVVGAATDGASLMDANAIPQYVIDSLYEDGTSVRELNYYYTIKNARTPESAEARLLDAIFGKGETYSYPVLGFGFYLPDVPESFTVFLVCHKDAFCQSDEERALYDKYFEEGIPAEIFFEDYEDKITFAQGFQAVISTILQRETGLPYSFWDSLEGEGNLPCIMIPEDHDEYNPEKLKEGLRRYAKELRVKRFGTCVHYQEREIPDKDIFSVGEGEK